MRCGLQKTIVPLKVGLYMFQQTLGTCKEHACTSANVLRDVSEHKSVGAPRSMPKCALYFSSLFVRILIGDPP